jgi:transcriptional regulator with XRE-family HTH domain
MEIPATFGSRLRSLRERKEPPMSQEQLAKDLEVSRASIGYYENASRTPDIAFLAKAAEYFDVSYDYLLGKSENTKREHTGIGEYLGLSDKAIEVIKKMHAKRTEQAEGLDLSYYNNQANIDWAIFEQLFYGDALREICKYVKQTALDPESFLVLSVRQGNQEEWVDARVNEILSKGKAAGSAERTAPSIHDIVVPPERMRTILLDGLAEELDKIRDTVLPG